MDTSTEKITSDDLIIINRSKTYHVSKKLICSSIPYFEKMFSCDLLESKENKVTLDLDEAAFQCILNAVLSNSYVLSIENILQMIVVADYLMIDELQNEMMKFFREKFTIELIPEVLITISESLKLINSRMVNAFIEAHFLKIVNTNKFLDYPVETVHHIISLNLHIGSEYQVFEAIDKWINKDLKSRKVHIVQLLKSIRWCHLNQQEMEKIKEDDLIEDISDFESIICQTDSCKGDCFKRRAKSKSLIAVLEVESVKIDLLIIDENYSCISSDHFMQCDTIRPNLIADENITDLIYDSGRKGICVDWKHKKYRYLDMIESDASYYGQIYSYIGYFYLIDENSKSFYLEKEVTKLTGPAKLSGISTLLESEGRFHTIGYTPERKLFVLSPVQHRSWFCVPFEIRSLHSCLNNNLIFVITPEGVHRLINMDTLISTDIKLTDDQKFVFANLQLTSLNSKFYLLDKSSKIIYILDFNSKKWKELVRIRTPHSLITLTTAYLPDDSVKPLFKVSQTEQ